MLYLVATPIGNLEDITLRAIRILKEVDTVLAEDTRKTGMLLKHCQIRKPLMSFFDHNEVRKLPIIIEELKQGKNFALVSDAGTPTLSDPGYKLVRECRKEGIPVTAIPGASSIINALSLSGARRDTFMFLGYFPRKSNERKKVLLRVKPWNSALVFFESPYRIKQALQDIHDVLGNRLVTVAREMTKKFEEIIECPVSEAIELLIQKKPKGEFTVIIDNRED